MSHLRTETDPEGRRALARTGLVAVLFLCASSVAGCRDEPRGQPPPPPAVSAPGACAGGGGTIADPPSAALFPRTAERFCLDPNALEKTYGESAKLPIDGICDMFDGECEIYLRHEVRRVVEARYVDGGGSTATIDVYLSKFGSAESAYAMFTKRVVGDGDPADDATMSMKTADAGGSAVVGLGNAYLWRGQYLAELVYNDEAAAEATLEQATRELLAPLVKEMGGRLPGEPGPPPSVVALPPGRVPLGVRLVTTDVLGIDGAGGGAFGYYRDGARRYRFVALLRHDADQAKDVAVTLARVPGASREKTAGEGGVRLMHREDQGPGTEWIFARRGSLVLGIGDEPRAVRAGMTADELARVNLPREDKIKRLREALSR